MDEGAGLIAGEGLFEIGDGLDPTVAQGLGDEWVIAGEILQAGAEGLWLFDQFMQVFGGVEGEDRA